MEELMHSPWALISAVAGAVILIRNGFSAVIDLVKWWKAPNADQNARIEALEKATTELQREAARIQLRLDESEDEKPILFKTLLALLGHGIDGNNVEEMRSAKQEIQNYLIKK